MVLINFQLCWIDGHPVIEKYRHIDNLKILWRKLFDIIALFVIYKCIIAYLLGFYSFITCSFRSL